MRFYIWLDDVRPIPQKVLDYCNENNISALQVTSVYAAKKLFVQCIRSEDIYLIDFDHDLGNDESGYDFAKWLLEEEVEPQYFAIHSMNPVGAKNIHQLLTHYNWKYLDFCL